MMRIREAGGRRRAAIALLAGVLAGCSTAADVAEFFRDETPHEQYERALAEAGLHRTTVGVAWLEAAAGALDSPVEISSPYEEQGYFDATRPAAAGYRLRLEKGQRVDIEVAVQTTGEPRIFLEVFRTGDENTPPRLVEHADSSRTALDFEPPNGGEYLVRLQPELLVDLSYRLTVRIDGSLAFPVADRGMSAILSYFGDPRDAGRRSHHGVDIFAPRGTPVVAVSDGVVSRVETTNLGGRVVWLRDAARNQSIYYAHLEEQRVEEGDRVQAGDVVGLVGNSGNARTTAPHLHFGIYRRRQGPIDPWHHIRRLPQEMPELTADVARLGSWVRVGSDGIRLRAAASNRSSIQADLPLNLPLRVVGAAGEWYRVEAPDGGEGFIAARLVRGVEAPIATVTAARSVPVYSAPDGAITVEEIPADASIAVHGEYGDFLLVTSHRGRYAWMREIAGG